MANRALRYVGPYAVAKVRLSDDRSITVERNKTAEFDGDIAKRLLQQKDIWEAAEKEPETVEATASAEPAPVKKGGKG